MVAERMRPQSSTCGWRTSRSCCQSHSRPRLSWPAPGTALPGWDDVSWWEASCIGNGLPGRAARMTRSESRARLGRDSPRSGNSIPAMRRLGDRQRRRLRRRRRRLGTRPLLGSGFANDLDAALEVGALFDGNRGRDQIADHVAALAQVDLVARRDFTLDRAVNNHLAGAHVGLHPALRTDRETMFGDVHAALELPLDQQVLLP